MTQEGSTIDLEHAIGYTGVISSSVIYHPNGEDYVYIAGGCVVIGNVNDPHNQHFLRGHDDNISCISLSKTGRLIASGQIGENADVCLWDFKTKSLLFRLDEHDHGVCSVAFSDDESLLVSIGDQIDKRMLVWDTSTGNVVASTAIPPAAKTIISWGGRVRDIKRRETKNYQLATASNNKILIWNLDPFTGEITKAPVNTGAFVRDYTCLCFAPEGDYLYAGTSSGDFSCISVRSYLLQTTLKACACGIRSLLVLSSGQKIIVGGGDSTVTVFSGSGKDFVDEQRAQLKEGGVTSLSLNQEETRIIAGTTSGDIYIIQTASLKSLLLSRSHMGPVLSVAYPKEVNDKFATISEDGTMRYWDATDYSVISMAAFKGNASPLCMCFVYDFIIVGFSDGSIKSVDSVSGDILWEVKQAHRAAVTAITAARSEKFFITGDQNGEIRVWTLKNREIVQTFKEHRSVVTDLEMLSDDTYLLSGSRDKSIFCWDLRKGRRISEQALRVGGINGLVLHNDQKTIISVSTSKQIIFWDIRQAEPTRLIEYSKSRVFEPTCVAISHDGRFFAVGGTDEKINFFETDSGAKIAVGKGHSGTVNRLRFSPDDKQLVSVGEDGCVFVWNVFT